MEVGEWMNEGSRQLIGGIILYGEPVIEEGFKQLSQFNNVILAGKKDHEKKSGFSFLIIQYDESGKEVFRSNTDEFQNANTIFLLRSNLGLCHESG